MLKPYELVYTILILFTAHSAVTTGIAIGIATGAATGAATATTTGAVVSLLPTSASGNLHLSLCGCGILGVFAVMIVL